MAARYEANPWNAEYRAIVDKLKSSTNTSASAVFREMEAAGHSFHNVREAYYGRSPADADMLNDLVRVVAELTGSPTPPPTVRIQADPHLHHLANDLRTMRAAVEAMCLSCAGETDVTKATCWDGSCPLRVVCPLPLRKSSGTSTRTIVYEE